MTAITLHTDPGDILSASQLYTNCLASPGDNLTWQALVVNGCRGAMEGLAELSSTDAIASMIQDFGFASMPALNLPVAEIELQTEITDLTISPLQMALAASAITNEGIVPAPRIVNGYQDPDKEWGTLPKLGGDSQAVDPTTASGISDILKIDGVARWQVSATTLTTENEPITWFIAGTTSDWVGQPLVVVVVLEEYNPEKAETIGLNLLGQQK